jgi:ceramide synthetase
MLRLAEAGLVVSFLVEIVGCFAVAGQAPGNPLQPGAVKAVLLALLPILYGAIVMIKHCGRVLAKGRLDTLYPNEPNRRHSYEVKFGDQSWQLVVHALLSALAYFILRFEDGGVAWLDDHTSLWLPELSAGVNAVYAAPSRPSVQLLYLLQAAVWIVTAISHIWLEERHKDYLMMLAHHVVTLALILLSYHFNFMRLGVVIMFLHDSSDIVIDLLKMCNYLNLEGAAGFFAVEACFITNFFTWAYARLYVFPVHVIWKAVMTAPREIATAPGMPGMEAFTAVAGHNGRHDAHTRGHAPGFSVPRDVGQGKFDLLANIRALPTHETIPMWWTSTGFLCALLAMNLVWYLMFWNILYKMVTASDSCNEVSETVYEGDREKLKSATAKQATKKKD